MVELIFRLIVKGLGLFFFLLIKESVKVVNRMKINFGIVIGVILLIIIILLLIIVIFSLVFFDGKKIVYLEVNVIKIISVDCVKRGKILKVKI